MNPGLYGGGLSIEVRGRHNLVMSRVRIVFVITDLHLGGSPLVVRDIGCGLVGGRGFEVSVVSLKALPVGGGGGIVGRMREAGVGVYSLNMRGVRDFPLGVLRLVRLLGRLRVEVVYSILVHANMVSTIAVGLLGKRPRLVQSIHTLQERPGWHWGVQGVVSGYADAVVAPAGAILERIGRYGSFAARGGDCEWD